MEITGGAASAATAPHKKIYHHLYFQVLCAIVIGVLVGYFYPQFGESLKWLGDLFIKLIKMLIAPIIFCTVVHGIASMEDMKKVGRVGVKALIYFEVMTTLALIVGLVVVNLWQPGSGMNVDVNALDTKAKGYEVLLLTDPVDEIWVGSVTEFDGKPLQSVAKGEVDLDSEEERAAHKAQRQKQERAFADLLTWLKETLSDHVKEVRLSTRLTESPACLITDTFGITPALARMYRASGQAVPVGKRILELNPKHPLVTGLQQAHKNRGDDSSLVETAELLYGTALLAEGGVPEDPAKFAGLLADRLARTV